MKVGGGGAQYKNLKKWGGGHPPPPPPFPLPMSLVYSLHGVTYLPLIAAGSQRVAERNADMHKIATNLTLCDDVSTGGK